MGKDAPTGTDSPAMVRRHASTLRQAGWTDAAIDLLARAAAGRFRSDIGIRLDLAQALLAAGRIDEAEAVRLPGPRA